MAIMSPVYQSQAMDCARAAYDSWSVNCCTDICPRVLLTRGELKCGLQFCAFHLDRSCGENKVGAHATHLCMCGERERER